MGLVSPERQEHRNSTSFIGAQLGMMSDGMSPALRIKKHVEGESGTTRNHELIKEEEDEDNESPYKDVVV